MYDKGYERQQILDLYRFIDWVMILPEAKEREFWQELQTFEEERKVTYVTHAQRFGFERGIQEGRQKGRQEGELTLIFRQLTRRIGILPETLRAEIRLLSLEQVEDLREALLEFTNLTDLQTWLRSNV